MPAAPVVVVADDDPDTLETISLALEGAMRGVKVRRAPDGPSALWEMDRGEVRVIIADARMPGMPGEAVLAWTRRHRPGIRRILMTGYSRIAAAEALAGSDAEAVLRKPFQVQDLARQVEPFVQPAAWIAPPGRAAQGANAGPPVPPRF